MPLLIYSVVRRHMKSVAGYVPHGAAPLPVTFDASGEGLLGWYRNPPPFDEAYVVFTDQAIHTRAPSGWLRLAYADVAGYEARRTRMTLAACGYGRARASRSSASPGGADPPASSATPSASLPSFALSSSRGRKPNAASETRERCRERRITNARRTRFEAEASPQISA